MPGMHVYHFPMFLYGKNLQEPLVIGVCTYSNNQNAIIIFFCEIRLLRPVMSLKIQT